jgi:hypothetical protein
VARPLSSIWTTQQVQPPHVSCDAPIEIERRRIGLTSKRKLPLHALRLDDQNAGGIVGIRAEAGTEGSSRTRRPRAKRPSNRFGAFGVFQRRFVGASPAIALHCVDISMPARMRPNSRP